MKKIFLFATIAFLFNSCSKDNSDNMAKVKLLGYACGAGCDARDYFISPAQDSNLLYLPINLPDDFKTDNLTVKVYFIKTGQYKPVFGGSAIEMIYVTSISR